MAPTNTLSPEAAMVLMSLECVWEMRLASIKYGGEALWSQQHEFVWWRERVSKDEGGKLCNEKIPSIGEKEQELTREKMRKKKATREMEQQDGNKCQRLEKGDRKNTCTLVALTCGGP